MNRHYEEKQMTESRKYSGASSTPSHQWDAINWKTTGRNVRRLQMRIAKAFREGKHSKVKSLQWLLTHSFYAKTLAVKRVVQNKGARTPGVDNVVWKTPKQKWLAVQSLKRRGYQPKPLRRIYIAKKQKGKLRPLSIPTQACRAQQALHLLALEPVAELMADKNTYGFRPLRSTADAIERCFNVLVKPACAQYILEGDIKSCFDSISHSWLLENIPMDKQMLKKWLDAGYLENGEFHLVEKGTPQGSLISPTLLNVTLAGLEAVISKVASPPRDKVYFCGYADDFIITGKTREVLEHQVKPALETFLKERGLTLSLEKTRIAHINKGFDFLGINIRKYDGKLIMKPAKNSVSRFLADIREIIKLYRTAKTENLIRRLNPKIRGWANYYCSVCSKKTFSDIDHHIFQALRKWCLRRHSTKSLKWVKQKYYRQEKGRSWIFTTKVIDKQGNTVNLDLVNASNVPIKRHIKIREKATPYDPALSCPPKFGQVVKRVYLPRREEKVCERSTSHP